MTTRPVRIQLEQAIYDRARQAAEADRRSLANWLALLVERAVSDTREPAQPRESEGEPR